MELVKKGFIEGGTTVTECQWHEDQWRKITSHLGNGELMGYEGPEGEFVQMEKPDFDEYDDNPDNAEFNIFPGDRIAVTIEGRKFLLSELTAQKIDFSALISRRVMHLLELGYYDTCIREACVKLEHEIKIYTNSRAWGDRLIKVFVEKIRLDKSFLESHIRTFQQELRSAFKFIRNEFMHNLHEADKASTFSILFRIARVRSMLNSDNEQANGFLSQAGLWVQFTRFSPIFSQKKLPGTNQCFCKRTLIQLIHLHGISLSLSRQKGSVDFPAVSDFSTPPKVGL